MTDREYLAEAKRTRRVVRNVRYHHAFSEVSPPSPKGRFRDSVTPKIEASSLPHPG